MSQYDVLVSATATVYKLIRVEADDEDTARAQASTEAGGLQSNEFQTTAENANGMEDYSISNINVMSVTEALEASDSGSSEPEPAAPPRRGPRQPEAPPPGREGMSLGFDF